MSGQWPGDPAIADVIGLEAALALLQAAATAATDAELAAAVATLEAALGTKQDASSAATDAEVADAIATVEAAMATDAELSAAIATVNTAWQTAVNALDARLITYVEATRIPDMVGSWWTPPACVYDPNAERVWISGSTRGGAVKLGVFDVALRSWRTYDLSRERHLADDHYTASLAFEQTVGSAESRRMFAVWSAHGRDNVMRLTEFDSYAAAEHRGPELLIETPGCTDASYGQIIPKHADVNVAIETTNASATIKTPDLPMTLTSGSKTISAPGHGLANDVEVVFETLPGGSGFVLSAGGSYFTTNVTADTFELRANFDSPTTVTATASGAAVAHKTHGYRDGRTLIFHTAPAGFDATTSYYTRDVTRWSFALATSQAGAAIVATATATGTIGDIGRGAIAYRMGGGTPGYWVARTSRLLLQQDRRSARVPPVFPDGEKFLLHDRSYMTTKRAGATLWCVALDHPISADPSRLYFFRITLSGNGLIKKADGTEIGALWAAVDSPVTSPMLTTAEMDLVSTTASPVGRRVFDIARGDAIAVCDFDRSDLPAGGTYKVLRRKTNAETNDWIAETVCPSGPPFGYDQSEYVGGMHFEEGATGVDAVIVVVNPPRDDPDGRATLQRWVRTGDTYPTTTAGTWALDAVIYTAPAGTTLGRPRVPLGSEGLSAGDRVCVVGEHERYALTSFLDFYGSQVLVTY